ncbi:hypothetical protein AAVH_00707 [Aphelenchoides avenae]|nr:hypothetical protein AAVH_00707 [Aphelenchus avenae]
MEPHMSRKDFFGLCAANALDELTESTYHALTEREQESLLEENLAPPVWCRAAELSPRPAIIPSLQRVRYLDPQLLPRCALIAITQGQYHIANNVDCPQYSSAFHTFFPDGRVPAEFFAQLVNCDLLKTEVGEKIASDLLEWLPKLDVNRLRRQIEQNDELQPRVLYRFDTLYNEVLEERDYSVEV